MYYNHHFEHKVRHETFCESSTVIKYYKFTLVGCRA